MGNIDNIRKTFLGLGNITKSCDIDIRTYETEEELLAGSFGLINREHPLV